jgi:hypothetical protein
MFEPTKPHPPVIRILVTGRELFVVNQGLSLSARIEYSVAASVALES